MATRSTRDRVRLVALPAVLAVVGLVSLPHLGQPTPDGRGWGPWRAAEVTEPGALAAVLVVIAAAGLLLRRDRPEAALVVTVAATGGYLALGYPFGPVLLSLGVAVYAIARRRPLRRAVGWGAAALVALVVLLLTREGALSAVAPGAPWVALPFAVGVARRLAVESADRARSEAVEAERLRLAQEVHDVVGHGLAAIQMQADIALHVHERRPEQPLAALRAISAASEEALTELRATLTQLRGDESTSPTPGLARLADLVGRVRASGVAVDLTVRGDLTGLPTATDLAAYRIVQESLTNVVRHSAHRAARVEVTRSEAGLEIAVTNRADRPADHTPGLGIAGMTRRAEQLGGRLVAGPGPTPGTFAVRATLPPPKETR